MKGNSFHRFFFLLVHQTEAIFWFILFRGSVSAIGQVPLTATQGPQNAGNSSAYGNAFQTCAAHSSIELMVFRGRAWRRNKNQETGERVTLTSWYCQPE